MRKNLAASAYSTVAHLGGQLALTPVLLHFWGQDLYAQWLILFAIPAYFSLSDAGISNSFGNALVIAVEQGRLDDAVRMARSVWFWQAMAWVTMLFLFFAGVAMLPLRTWLAIPEMPFNTFATVSLLLAIYSFGSLQGGYYTALFRAGGEYAHLVRLLGHMRVAEVVLHAMVAALGGKLVMAASTLLVIRCVFYAWCHRQRDRLLPGIDRGGPRLWKEFYRLLPSGLGFMAFPIGNALINQGSALFVKHLAGSGEVVLLAVGRQFARVFMQGASTLFQSVHPEMSAAFAKSDFIRMLRLQAQAIAPLLWASPVFIAGMAAFAPWGIRLWTHGSVFLCGGLAALFAAEAVAAGLSNNAMLVGWATNRLKVLCISYIITQALALVVASIFYPSLGIYGLLWAFAMTPLFHVFVGLHIASQVTETKYAAVVYRVFVWLPFRITLHKS